jgi:hypothetical protein
MLKGANASGDHMYNGPVRKELVVRRIPLAEEGRPHDGWPATPADGVAVMWQLALQAWMFKEGLVDEPRLRRDVVRTLRGGR